MEDPARPAGVSNTALRARSADYIDFGGQRGRRHPQNPLDSEGEKPAGRFRQRSPPLDIAATSDDEAQSPSKRETQLSPHMRSGEDARNALQASGSRIKRSASMPERCFYEACKPATAVPVKVAENSALPTNPNWLKTRLAALREQDEFPRKVQVRVAKQKANIGEVPSVLTGYGERAVYRFPSPRLRGEAAIAIGEAGKASHGVPWRSLPAYNKGALCQTNLVYVPERKRVQALGEYSEKLGDNTLKELLYPDAQPSPKAAKDGQFEAWLLSVQTCLQSMSRTPTGTSSRRAGSPTLTEKQQLSKPMKAYLESDLSTKEACPFARNDHLASSRPTLPPTVTVRVRVPPPLTRRAPEIAPADLVEEKSRTWQFMQDMAQIRNGLPANGYRSPRRSLGSALPPQKEESFLLKVRGCSSASQSTLEPDRSARTPVSPLSPMASPGTQEALRPRWK